MKGEIRKRSAKSTNVAKCSILLMCTESLHVHAYGVKLVEYTFKLGLGLGKRGCESSAGITLGKGSWARVGTRLISIKFLGSKLYQRFRA